MMLEKGGPVEMDKKAFFFWLMKPVQQIDHSDFLPISTARGRQHSYDGVSRTVRH